MQTSQSEKEHQVQTHFSEEIIIEGVAVAPGIAIGRAYRYTRDAYTAEEGKIDPAEIPFEVGRFEKAVRRSEKEISKIINVARERIGNDSAAVFEAQMMVLRDPELYDDVLHGIKTEHWPADFALQTVMNQHIRRLELSDSVYLRERAQDLLDIEQRILRNMYQGQMLSKIDRNSIVFAENLTAADIILFSRNEILGCALDYGGATSHVSIMARALGVPAVVGIHDVSPRITTGDLVILDGLNGRIILNPSEENLALYRIKQERYGAILLEHKELVKLPPQTQDGHRVILRANLDVIEDLKRLKTHGAEGIGLCRTEMFFLAQGQFLDEDEQHQAYVKIISRSKPDLVTFRMLDIGGDKTMPMGHREQNPFLGWRGMRVMLDRPAMLKTQLRALLRASTEGPIRILLPMITSINEVKQFNSILENVQASLDRDGIPYYPGIPIGIMVEVPSVALMPEVFAPEVDFFSIGTNDLTQYVLAVDRGNDLVSDLYEELHPVVLNLIKQIIDVAHSFGIKVSLCGEMAARPRATPLLLGLGLDEFSASPIFLPEVRRVIRALSLQEAQRLAEFALAQIDAESVRNIVDTWLKEHGCGLLQRLEQEGTTS